jgi:hypothetical protein
VTTLNRLINMPPANSRAMRAYMQAILEITGMYAQQQFPLERFMKNFATHLSPKQCYPYATLRREADGLYTLTAEGAEYFSSRLSPEPIVPGQKVGRSEVVEMMRSILASVPLPGWEAFDVEFAENA